MPSMGALLRWALPVSALSKVALEVMKLLLSLLDQQSAWVLSEWPWEQVESLLLWGEKMGKFYKQQSHLLSAELGNDI